MSRGARETDPPDWLAILEALVRGDRVAFARWNRLVTGFLLQFRAYDFEDEWDDLRQEVLSAVVENFRAGRLRDPQALVGYARIIARNKFTDRLKRRLRCGERDTLPWEEEISRAAFPAATTSTTEAQDLRRALDHLDERERSLIERVYLAGETYEEASRATGIPLGTLKRRLRDGLQLLREALGGTGELES